MVCRKNASGCIQLSKGTVKSCVKDFGPEDSFIDDNDPSHLTRGNDKCVSGDHLAVFVDLDDD